MHASFGAYAFVHVCTFCNVGVISKICMQHELKHRKFIQKIIQLLRGKSAECNKTTFMSLVLLEKNVTKVQT